MSSRKLLIVIGVFAVVMFQFALNAHAGASWYTATVEMVGPDGNDRIFIKLTHAVDSPVFEKKWCKIPKDQENLFFATALTAINSDLEVYVRLDAAASYPEIEQLYLKK